MIRKHWGNAFMETLVGDQFDSFSVDSFMPFVLCFGISISAISLIMRRTICADIGSPKRV